MASALTVAGSDCKPWSAAWAAWPWRSSWPKLHPFTPTQVVVALIVTGREPRRRASDLMIAATAASNQLPLYTANPGDFKGTEGFVEVVGIQPGQTISEWSG